MSLRVWLPLTKDLRQQGLSNVTVTNNGATFNSAGKLGGCYSFGNGSASSNGLFLNSNLVDLMQEEYSVAVWVKPLGNHYHYNGTIFSSGNWNNTCYAFGLSQDNSQVDILCKGYNTYLTCAVPINIWTHLVCTCDSSNVVRLYKNGEYIGSSTRSNKPDSDNTTQAAIGRETYASGYFTFNGMLNDFRLYDHCLSPMEVKELAKGLVLHYPLNRQGWGQENLYTGSRDFSGSWTNGSAWTTSSETYEGFTVKQKSSVWGGLTQNIPCSNGDIFTVSFYAKVTSGGNILSIHRSSLGNVTTGLTILGGNFSSSTSWINTGEDGTQWKRYWATVQITSSDITYLQWRIENSVADKTLYVCGMKLEKGSIATPWCPNSSDTLATTMGLDSTTEYDCSGYCNNGTWHGTHTNTSDTPKYAVSTTATGSGTTYLEGPVLPAEAKTVALWIKNTSKSSNGAIFNDKTSGLQIGLLNSLLYMNSAASTAGFTTTHWVNGEWNHVVAINNNGTRSLYVNGQAETQSGASNYYIHNADNCWLWNRSYNNSYPFTGSLCDLRVYATALSADDVLSLYQNSAYIDSSGNVYGAVHTEV